MDLEEGEVEVKKLKPVSMGSDDSGSSTREEDFSEKFSADMRFSMDDCGKVCYTVPESSTKIMSREKISQKQFLNMIDNFPDEIASLIRSKYSLEK